MPLDRTLCTQKQVENAEAFVSSCYRVAVFAWAWHQSTARLMMIVKQCCAGVVHASMGQSKSASSEHLRLAQQCFQAVGSSPAECDTIPGTISVHLAFASPA